MPKTTIVNTLTEAVAIAKAARAAVELESPDGIELYVDYDAESDSAHIVTSEFSKPALQFNNYSDDTSILNHEQWIHDACEAVGTDIENLAITLASCDDKGLSYSTISDEYDDGNGYETFVYAEEGYSVEQVIIDTLVDALNYEGMTEAEWIDAFRVALEGVNEDWTQEKAINAELARYTDERDDLKNWTPEGGDWTTNTQNASAALGVLGLSSDLASNGGGYMFWLP